MNRNNEAHFNQIPKTNISRSRFKRDQNVKLTFDAGKLVPFYVDEVLPGDTFSVDTTGIVRMTTPIFPVMDNCYLDLYYFFTPNRIVWEHWREFMGENTAGAWRQKTEYSVPKLKMSGYILKASDNTTSNGAAKTVPEENTVLDYMGVPTKINKSAQSSTSDIGVNALPVRSYVKIWNEWFRDQNLTDPVTEYKDDTSRNVFKLNAEGATETQLNETAKYGMSLLPVAKFHDYFTSALPEPQKGPEVNVPMNGVVPVKAYTNGELNKIDTFTNKYFSSTATNDLYNAVMSQTRSSDPLRIAGSNAKVGTTAAQYSYLGAELKSVEATTINELRQAFAVQHYYEALARGGSRYREIIRSMFGTLISDKTVQIPEYLGGGRYMINVSQVVQTSASTESSPQGNASAISVTPFSENSFTKSFEEHGFIIGVMCVRHDHTYQQGVERFWSREDTLDYYFPQFANLGEQAIKRKELYTASDQTKENDDAVFGYQEAWAEYRMKPNRVCGKFRSNAEGTLDSWHYADNYNSTPYLSDEWIREGKAEIQRTLAVQDEPQFIADILIKNTTTRPMPLYSVPGLEKL